jgi:hypothetical protein
MFRDDCANEILRMKAESLGYTLIQRGGPGYPWTGVVGFDESVTVEEVLERHHDYTLRDAFWEAAKQRPDLEVCPKVAWSKEDADRRNADFQRWKERRGADVESDPLLA